MQPALRFPFPRRLQQYENHADDAAEHLASVRKRMLAAGFSKARVL